MGSVNLNLKRIHIHSLRIKFIIPKLWDTKILLLHPDGSHWLRIKVPPFGDPGVLRRTPSLNCIGLLFHTTRDSGLEYSQPLDPVGDIPIDSTEILYMDLGMGRSFE